MKTALQLVDAGRFDEAKAVLERLLAERGPEADLLRLLGKLQFHTGDLAGGRQRLEAALALAPTAAGLSYELGVIALGSEDWPEAMAAFRRELELDPSHPGARYNLAWTLRRIGNQCQAIEVLRALVGDLPHHLPAWQMLGTMLLEERQPEEAVVALERVVALEPTAAEVANTLGNTLTQLGRRAEAVRVYQAALNHTPDHAAILSNLAFCLDRLNRLEEAVVAGRRAVEVAPEVAGAWNILGVIEWRRQQLPAAEAALNRALILTPDAPEVLNNLGIVQTALGQLEAAQASFHRARSAYPDHPLIQANLDRSLSWTGAAETEAIDNLALPQAVDYAIGLAESYLGHFKAGGYPLAGSTVLEIGPGRNRGLALLLASQGARLMVADRFLAPWDDTYHPAFYRLLGQRCPAAAPLLERVVANGGYQGVLTLLAQPAEALTGVADQSVDLVVSHAVLEHLSDLTVAAGEFWRVTRPGGAHFHQIDFRDHRDFSRPLDFLLLDEGRFQQLFQQTRAETGSRLRRGEAEQIFRETGFVIDRITDTEVVAEAYLDEILPFLRRSGSRYAEWPEADLRILGAHFIFHRP